MNHEELRCYRKLIKLAEEIARGMTKWPRGHGYLCDQLRRAIASAVLNLGEGNVKRSSVLERRRFFEIALGSMAEVGACLDLAHVLGLISRSFHESFKSRLKLAYVQVRALP